MKSIESAYINALLADAAYVSVSPSSSLGTELSIRLTPTQASLLAANFDVVDSVETLGASGSTGFDAVVWKGKAGSDYADKVFVSMRGTQGTQTCLTMSIFPARAWRTSSCATWSIGGCVARPQPDKRFSK